MDFGGPGRKPVRENIVPMINVVFLLLIFFLMTAQIAPPEPFEIDPPVAQAERAGDGEQVLYLSADGELAFLEVRGDAAVAAAVEAASDAADRAAADGAADGAPLYLRVDRTGSAADAATLIGRLAAAGVRDIRLITVAE